MKAIVCDKCKKVITDEKGIKDTMILDLCSPFSGKFREMHICDDCKSKFYDWFKCE